MAAPPIAREDQLIFDSIAALDQSLANGRFMPHALIVEDDANLAESLAALVKGEGFTTAIAGTLREAREQLILHVPDLVLLDLVLPDGSGMTLFEDRDSYGNVEILLMTGHASLDTSIQALRLGAADYLIKPVDPKVLKGALSRTRPPSQVKAEIVTLRHASTQAGHFGRLWGRSAPMQKVYSQIARVSGTSVTVMVTGESGSGKEVVAQTIHDLSRRRKQPFLAVNCGAISPQLIESEMFGHEKGSFTGAHRQHRGFFEQANGGTLFLDEITEMPMALQVKLLRVLETGSYMRVGSDEIQSTDVRIIAATNRVPLEAVDDNKLREDLYYRLNVFQIHLPPLRDRLDDVELLAQHFLVDLNEREKTAKRFDAEAVAALIQYSWPGNVRELRNAVHRAYVMAEGELIDRDCLPFEPPSQPAAPSSPGTERPTVAIPLGSTIAEMEREYILATIASVNGQKERAAEILGVSVKTLYNRLREYSSQESGSLTD